jgi:hypothetical protein
MWNLDKLKVLENRMLWRLFRVSFLDLHFRPKKEKAAGE